MSAIINLLKLIKDNDAKFVSLKYVNIIGKLQQIDFASQNLVIIDDCIIIGNIKLKPIEDKCFFDPFRSSPTIFCLCENLAVESDPRILVKKSINDHQFLENIKLELAINFFVFDKKDSFLVLSEQSTNCQNCQNQVEPYDKLANLRAEIVEILEKIGISTVYHCHASKYCSCSIIIKAKNFLDMADNYFIASFIIMNVVESYGKLAYFSKQLANNLFILLSDLEYNKEFARLFISRIIKLKNSMNNLISGFDSRDNISDSYYYHDIIRNSHIINCSLQQQINPYKFISNFMLCGFNIQSIEIFNDHDHIIIQENS